jgi:hypothetical protein
MIFYEPLPDDVAIVRVLHGARDTGAQFEGSDVVHCLQNREFVDGGSARGMALLPVAALFV